MNVKPSYVYQQYRGEQWLIDFFNVIDSLKQEDYYNNIEKYINIRNIVNPIDDNYLSFYTKYLLGVYRPIGGNSVANYFDLNDYYDEELSYDDSIDFNGKITMEDFSVYLAYIYNYSYEIFNIDYLCRFIASWCNIFISEIKINLDTPNKIIIKLPSNQKNADFIKLVINYFNEMGFPFGVDLDIRI